MLYKITILVIGFVIAFCLTAIGLAKMRDKAIKIGKGQS
jgi:hypothetical protein